VSAISCRRLDPAPPDMLAQWTDLARELLFGNSKRRSIPNLDGPWRPNESLEACPILPCRIKQADGVAADARGTLYASSQNKILALSGPRFDRVEEVASFQARVSGLAWSAMVGLVAGVAGTGVVVLGSNGERRVLPPINGPLRCVTDIALSDDGIIYATDGSLQFEYGDWVQDLMNKGESGRLVRYAADLRSGDVVASGLAFPMGIALDQSKGALIVPEAWRHRVLRFPINPAGEPQIVADDLPGYPTRIAADGAGGWWLSFIALRTQLVEFVLREDEFRRRMVATIPVSDWIAPSVSALSSPLQPQQLGALHTHGVKKPWAPPRSYGLVAHFNSEFNCTASFHSRSNGTRHGTTGLVQQGGKLYVASQGGDCILVLNLEGGHEG
jgi:Strictosidine synthase